MDPSDQDESVIILHHQQQDCQATAADVTDVELKAKKLWKRIPGRRQNKI